MSTTATTTTTAFSFLTLRFIPNKLKPITTSTSLSSSSSSSSLLSFRSAVVHSPPSILRLQQQQQVQQVKLRLSSALRPTTTTTTTSSKKMILRLRSNLGTWRFDVSSTTTTLHDLIQQHLQGHYPDQTLDLQHGIALQPPTMQTAATTTTTTNHHHHDDNRLNIHVPLNVYNKDHTLKHGTMLFCRFRPTTTTTTDAAGADSNDDTITPRDMDPTSSSNRNVAGIKGNSSSSSSNRSMKLPPPSSKKDSVEVIDLLDSDDDDNDDNDDDEVVVVTGPSSTKKRKTVTTTSSSNSSSNNNDPLSKRNKQSIDKKKRSNGHGCEKQQHQSSSSSLSSSSALNDNNNDRFQVASYNVWFGPGNEHGELFGKDRMTAIAQYLQDAAWTSSSSSSRLQFIGFQELTPSLASYLKPILNNMGYQFCTQPLGTGIGGGGGSPYGVGLAIANDLEIMETNFVPYTNSLQGRGLLYVQTPTVLFATTHLESWCGPHMTGATEREEQLIEAASFCQRRVEEEEGRRRRPNLSTAQQRTIGGSTSTTTPRPSCPSIAILTGDLNWDDERVRNTGKPTPNRKLLDLLDPQWKDSSKPLDYTYDSKENPMLAGNLRRRFDRCLYFCQGPTTNPSSTMMTGHDHSSSRKGTTKALFTAVDFRKIGKDPIQPARTWTKTNPYNGSTRVVPVCASDHFGIVIGFEKNV